MGFGNTAFVRSQCVECAESDIHADSWSILVDGPGVLVRIVTGGYNTTWKMLDHYIAKSIQSMCTLDGMVNNIFIMMDDSFTPETNYKEPTQRKRKAIQQTHPYTLPKYITDLSPDGDRAALDAFFHTEWWLSSEEIPENLINQVVHTHRYAFLKRMIHAIDCTVISSVMHPKYHIEAERKIGSVILNHLPLNENVYIIGCDTDIIGIALGIYSRVHTSIGMFVYKDLSNRKVYDFKASFGNKSEIERLELLLRMITYCDTDLETKFPEATIRDKLPFTQYFNNETYELNEQTWLADTLNLILGISRAVKRHDNCPERIIPFLKRSIFAFILFKSIYNNELGSIFNYGFIKLNDHILLDGPGPLPLQRKRKRSAAGDLDD